MTKLKVNRRLSPQGLLDSTKRVQYINKDVLNTISKGEGRTVELEFFKLDKYSSDNDLETEYASRGLVAADLYSIVAYDLKFPKEIDTMKYVGTHWKDKDGNWCFAAFSQWYDGERDVYVYRRGRDWGDVWWFAGVRKLALKPSDAQNLALEPLDSSLEKRIKALEEWKDKITKA